MGKRRSCLSGSLPHMEVTHWFIINSDISYEVMMEQSMYHNFFTGSSGIVDIKNAEIFKLQTTYTEITTIPIKKIEMRYNPKCSQNYIIYENFVNWMVKWYFSFDYIHLLYLSNGSCQFKSREKLYYFQYFCSLPRFFKNHNTDQRTSLFQINTHPIYFACLPSRLSNTVKKAYHECCTQ